MNTSRAISRSVRAPVRAPFCKPHHLSLHCSRARFHSAGSSRSKQAASSSRVFKVSEEVQHATSNHLPIVALETTIYTHGFPYPDNCALAADLEAVVRANGAIPATIGVLDGVARVGMSEKEQVQLMESAGDKTMKVSRRDMPFITGLGVAGRRLNGGTTISGTMMLAEMAGIEILGTGGLGGVHRGAELTMDVSADLTELGKTRVTVISSGCKSFLDLRKTLEYLETQGVCVGTFRDGRKGEINMPGFYTRDSGVKSPFAIEDEVEAASIIFAHNALGTQAGLFFGNPIPEEFSIPQAQINDTIEAAVREATEKGYHGHANTPFILAKIKELTGGKSIPANRALIESNVARAARVAVQLAKLRADDGVRGGLPGSQSTSFMPAVPRVSYTKPDQPSPASHSLPQEPPVGSVGSPTIIVAGSIAVDLSCDYIQPPSKSNPDSSSSHTPTPKTSNPASITQTIGGVGHNVAYAAHLVSPKNSVQLTSLIADDLAGSLITSSLQSRGLDTTGIKILPADGYARTAQYVAVNDTAKDLVVAMADMDIIGAESHVDAAVISGRRPAPRYVVVDGNWHPRAIRSYIDTARSTGAKTVFEPVSVAKSRRLFPPLSPQSKKTSSVADTTDNSSSSLAAYGVDMASPNEFELQAMYETAKSNEYFESAEWWAVVDAMGISSAGARVQFTALTNAGIVDRGIPQMVLQLLPFVPVLVTKLGAQGVLVARLLSADDPALTASESAPYILSRCTNGTDLVGGVYMRLYPPAEVLNEAEVVSVNGVGDTFLGVLVAGLAKGMELDERLVGIAQRGAVMTLKSKESVSAELASLAAELVV